MSNMMNARMSKAKPMKVQDAAPKYRIMAEKTRVIGGKVWTYHATKGWRVRKVTK